MSCFDLSFQQGMWELLYTGYPFDPDWVYFKEALRQLEQYFDQYELDEINAVSAEEWIDIWEGSPWNELICVMDMTQDVVCQMVSFIKQTVIYDSQ